MSRLKSKLILKRVDAHNNDGKDGFTIVKAVNTLSHGLPGDFLDRETVDKILKSAENRGPRDQLTVEFIT